MYDCILIVTVLPNFFVPFYKMLSKIRIGTVKIVPMDNAVAAVLSLSSIHDFSIFCRSNNATISSRVKGKVIWGGKNILITRWIPIVGKTNAATAPNNNPLIFKKTLIAPAENGPINARVGDVVSPID
jgi:hypothetical protein